MPQLTTSHGHRRAGFSLVEVLMVLTLLGIIGAALISMITRQQRFYRDTSASLVVRRELRGGASLLPTEMRAISAHGKRDSTESDITARSSTMVEFRATFGSSIICEKPSGAFTTFSLPPTNLANHTLTSWYELPATGDEVAIFDEGALAGAEDDDWVYATIVTVASDNTACSPSVYMDATADAPALKPRHTITVTPKLPLTVLPATIQTGAVVRFLRPVRYRLYQPGGSTRWFLGYEQKRNNSWTTTDPVAGPFEPSANTGLRFQYYDVAGNLVNGASLNKEISRIDVLLKGKADFAAAAERRGTPFRDSLMFRIGLRNFK